MAMADEREGNAKLIAFQRWLDEQGADFLGQLHGGEGRLYNFYVYKKRVIILERYPKGHGFEVYVPVTDQNSVEAVQRGLLAMTDPDPGRERQLEAKVAQMVADLKHLNCGDSALDELVHDVKGEEAAAINNGGLADQVEFLLRAGCTEQDVLAAVAGDEDEDEDAEEDQADDR